MGLNTPCIPWGLAGSQAWALCLLLETLGLVKAGVTTPSLLHILVQSINKRRWVWEAGECGRWNRGVGRERLAEGPGPEAGPTLMVCCAGSKWQPVHSSVTTGVAVCVHLCFQGCALPQCSASGERASRQDIWSWQPRAHKHTLRRVASLFHSVSSKAHHEDTNLLP